MVNGKLANFTKTNAYKWRDWYEESDYYTYKREREEEGDGGGADDYEWPNEDGSETERVKKMRKCVDHAKEYIRNSKKRSSDAQKKADRERNKKRKEERAKETPQGKEARKDKSNDRRERQNGMRKEERANETSEEREERKDKRNKKQKEKSKEERQILVDRKNASIARERAEPTIMNEIVKDDLYDLHSASTSSMIVNSMRLRHLRERKDEEGATQQEVDDYERAVRDTAEDIETFVKPGTEKDLARKFRAKEKSMQKLRVCATCGRRDPRCNYKSGKQLFDGVGVSDKQYLEDVSESHWVVVPEPSMKNTIPADRLDAVKDNGKDALFTEERTMRLIKGDTRFDKVPKEDVAKDYNFVFEQHFVSVSESELYNLTELEIQQADGEFSTKWYHVVPSAIEEVVDEGGNIRHKFDVCEKCYPSFSKWLKKTTEEGGEKQIPKQIPEGPSDLLRFDGNRCYAMYSPSAPAQSIAAGDDFGRLDALRKQGVATDVTMLEMLILARARSHFAVVELSLDGRDTGRRSLASNTIIFPQKAIECEDGETELTSTRMMDALVNRVKVLFVGPESVRTPLETAMLTIPDFRVRPEVIYNFLVIEETVQGRRRGSSIVSEDHKKLRELFKWVYFDEEKLVSEFVKKAKEQIETDASKAVSDCAGVRQPGAFASSTSDDVGTLPISSNTAGVLSMPRGDYTPTLNAIDNIFSEADHPDGEGIDLRSSDANGTTCGYCEVDCGGRFHAVCHGCQHKLCQTCAEDLRQGVRCCPTCEQPTVPFGDSNKSSAARQCTDGGDMENVLKMKREAAPANDYDGASSALYDSFWPLFILRRGLDPKKPLSDDRMRLLMTYYDNRFAQNMPLLFNLANIKMRHDVNNAVCAKVKSDAKSFAKFKQLLIDPEFRSKLDAALKDPQSKETEALVRTVSNFIQVAGQQVRWGPYERSKEVTNLLAMQRAFGAGSIFYSIAPDDVHNPLSVLLSTPHQGTDKFPHAVNSRDAFFTSLQGTDSAARAAFGSTEGGISCEEGYLQNLASKNPVAMMIAFDCLLDNVQTNLLGLDPGELTSKPLAKATPGLWGRLAANRHVIETNKRHAPHVHGQTYGGGHPTLLAHVAEIGELRSKIMELMDGHVQAEIPLEYHALHVAWEQLVGQKKDRQWYRRDASCEIPDPDRPDSTDWEEQWTRHVMCTVMNRHHHRHAARCLDGKRGKTRCSLCMPHVHDIEHTTLSELKILRGPKEAGEEVCAPCDTFDALDGEAPQRAAPGPQPHTCGTCFAKNPEERDEELLRRGIIYENHTPSNLPLGRDPRALVVDMKSRVPPRPCESLMRECVVEKNELEHVGEFDDELTNAVCSPRRCGQLCKARHHPNSTPRYFVSTPMILMRLSGANR